MDNNELPRYSDAECESAVAELFPNGFAGQDVLRDLAPDGWEKSPLMAVFHPTLEQVYQRSVELHRRFQSWPLRPKDRPPDPEPTREETAKTYEQKPIEIEQEVRQLVGECLWDVFSDNHDVIGPDGRIVDLGSWRGTGSFIADCINRQAGVSSYVYIDFYMGTVRVGDWADLRPVYRMIFRRLKSLGYDWRYSFPRLHLLDMRGVREALGESPEQRPSGKSRQSDEKEAHEREVDQLRKSMDDNYREAVVAARRKPPPATVDAYASIYGHFPEGWPPDIER